MQSGLCISFISISVKDLLEAKCPKGMEEDTQGSRGRHEVLDL